MNTQVYNPVLPVLLEEITERKRNMYLKAKHFGFTHPSVIACSQELDNLLNKYQDFKNPGLQLHHN